MQYTLEIATFNVQSALAAAQAGASRLEVCDNMHEGGTTPSYGTISYLKSVLTVPVFAMVRPRGGDFLYSAEEWAVMKQDLQHFKALGCEGVVAGFLLADGTVDRKRTAEFVSLAYPMEVTFHRAFDHAANALEALETIIQCGCQRVLTSGQVPVAADGLALLKELVQQADDRIIIMPGSGVRQSNIAAIALEAGAVELHSSARIMQPSAMKYENANMQEEMHQPFVDEEEIRAMVVALEKLAQ